MSYFSLSHRNRGVCPWGAAESGGLWVSVDCGTLLAPECLSGVWCHGRTTVRTTKPQTSLSHYQCGLNLLVVIAQGSSFQLGEYKALVPKPGANKQLQQM